MKNPTYLIECRRTKQRHALACTKGEWYAHLKLGGVGAVGQYVGGCIFRNSLGDYTVPAGSTLSVTQVDCVVKSTN